MTSRLEKIDVSLDAVDTALDKEQLQTAQRKLGEAQRAMEEIDRRYANRIPADDQHVKAARDRLDSATGKVSDAERAAAAAAEARDAAERHREEQSRQWIERLSPFRDYKSQKYLRIGSDFNNATEEQQAAARAAYQEAKRLMAEYRATDFAFGKTFELRSLEGSLTSTMMIWDATQEREQREAACAPWVARLRPYVDVGAGSRKYLVAGVTLDENEIRQRAELLDEARAVWADYQKADFPLGKSENFQGLELAMQASNSARRQAGSRKSSSCLRTHTTLCHANATCVHVDSFDCVADQNVNVSGFARRCVANGLMCVPLKQQPSMTFV